MVAMMAVLKVLSMALQMVVKMALMWAVQTVE